MDQQESRVERCAEMVSHARELIDNLAPGELEIELTRGVVLIDLREEDEIRTHGRISDSVWAPRGMLEFWADPTSPMHRMEFDPDTRIVLYCAVGGRSALAGETLRRLGYHSVAHLDGGIRAWKDSGRNVEPAE